MRRLKVKNNFGSSLNWKKTKFNFVEFIKSVGEKVGNLFEPTETREPTNAEIAAEKVDEEKKFDKGIDDAKETLKQDQKEFGECFNFSLCCQLITSKSYKNLFLLKTS